MKTCLRIPRILLPVKDSVYWPVIACDQFTSDREYWRRVGRAVGSRPSTLRFILPEAYLGEEDEERIKEIHENMCEAMIDGWMYKLDRGFVLTERTTQSGTRRGIVAAIDLEAYTYGAGESSPVRSSEAVVPSRLPARVAVRRGATLEFPHALLFYSDKKNKVMRMLEYEDLEQLYDVELMEGGGRLTGYFIPEDLAADVAAALQTRGEPSFVVADGNHSVAAAKAYWEELKEGLSERERRTHPARFALVELVNLYDDAVVFHPIHRLVTETDAEAFCDYFSSAVPCRREGNVLYPRLSGGAEAVAKTDELIEKFLRSNVGKVDYVHGERELTEYAARENCAGVALAPMEKEDFFAQLKGGKNFPKKTFSIGEAREKRYYMEGREISYD